MPPRERHIFDHQLTLDVPIEGVQGHRFPRISALPSEHPNSQPDGNGHAQDQTQQAGAGKGYN